MVKRLKDSNAPKRPMSPYFQWMKMNRKKVVQSMHIGYSFKQLSAKMGQMWAALPEEQKVPLNEKFKEEMKTYVKLMAAYKHTSNYKKYCIQKRELKRAKTKKFHKDPNRPKAPSSAYFLFLGDKREEVKKNFQKLGQKELISKLGEMWSKLSDAEKLPYMTTANQEKSKWLEDIKEYQKTNKYKEYLEAKRAYNKSRRAKEDESNPKTARKKSSLGKGSKLSKKKISKGRGCVKSPVVKKAGSKAKNTKKLAGKKRKTRSKSR